jgi:hypothetical protein
MCEISNSLLRSPVTTDEVRAASLQFVRKISGFNKPSKANEASFLGAVDEVATISMRLLHSLKPHLARAARKRRPRRELGLRNGSALNPAKPYR